MCAVKSVPCPVIGDYGKKHKNCSIRPCLSVDICTGMMINDGSTLTAYQFGAEPVVYDCRDDVMVSTGINVPPCGWYYNELKHFLECIRENKATPYVSREQLLTVMKVLEEISAPWRK